MAHARKLSGKAIAALVLAFCVPLSPINQLIGIVLAILGLRDVRRLDLKGKALSWWALGLNIASLVVVILLTVWYTQLVLSELDAAQPILDACDSDDCCRDNQDRLSELGFAACLTKYCDTVECCDQVTVDAKMQGKCIVEVLRRPAQLPNTSQSNTTESDGITFLPGHTA